MASVLPTPGADKQSPPLILLGNGGKPLGDRTLKAFDSLGLLEKIEQAAAAAIGSDISSEQLISMSEASHLLPGRPSIATVNRWRRRGVAGIRLESITRDGQVYTSREALQRFADRQNADAVKALMGF